MKRRAFDLLAGLSLVLLIGTLALWIWFGRYRSGFAFIPTTHAQFDALAIEHKLVLRLSHVPWPLRRGFERQQGNLVIAQDLMDHSDVGDHALNGRASENRYWMFGDFAIARVVHPYTSRSGRAGYNRIEFTVLLPYWLLALVFAIAPAWWYGITRRRRLREARASRGQCLACGYDLRATPDRCPECGSSLPNP